MTFKVGTYLKSIYGPQVIKILEHEFTHGVDMYRTKIIIGYNGLPYNDLSCSWTEVWSEFVRELTDLEKALL